MLCGDPEKPATESREDILGSDLLYREIMDIVRSDEPITIKKRIQKINQRIALSMQNNDAPHLCAIIRDTFFIPELSNPPSIDPVESVITTAMAFNHDGSVIAHAYSNDTVVIGDSKTNACIRKLEVPYGKKLSLYSHNITAMVMSPACITKEDSKIFLAREDGTLTVFSMQSGEHLTTISFDRIRDIAMTADGKHLFVSNENEIIEMDTSTFQYQPKKINLLVHKIGVAAFSQHAETTLIAEDIPSFTIKVYYNQSGKSDILGGAKGHLKKVDHLAMSPDGTLIASLSNTEKVLKIWRPPETCVHTLALESYRIQNLFFSSDSSYLFLQSINTFIVYNCQTGLMVGKRIFEKAIGPVALFFDELAIAFDDGSIQKLNVNELIDPALDSKTVSIVTALEKLKAADLLIFSLLVDQARGSKHTMNDKTRAVIQLFGFMSSGFLTEDEKMYIKNLVQGENYKMEIVVPDDFQDAKEWKLAPEGSKASFYQRPAVINTPERNAERMRLSMNHDCSV